MDNDQQDSQKSKNETQIKNLEEPTSQVEYDVSIPLVTEHADENQMTCYKSEATDKEIKFPERQRKVVSLQYHLPVENSHHSDKSNLGPSAPTRAASCNIDFFKTDNSNTLNQQPDISNLTSISAIRGSTPTSTSTVKTMSGTSDSKWNKVKKVLLPSANFTTQSAVDALPNDFENKHCSSTGG